MLTRIVIAAALLVALHFLPVTGWIRFGCYMVPYLVIGYDILRKAARGVKNRQVFDENFLMAVATVGAIALAVYEGSGDYTEAVAVMLFYQIGEWFQSYAVGRSRRNISELMDIRPDYANVERDGRLTRVDPDEVAVGTVIVVQPGEKVPIDGVVTEGSSALNTAALTGESLPRDVGAGDEVVVRLRQHDRGAETPHHKGVRRVHRLQNSGPGRERLLRKSRSEDFISRFAWIYTPAVCGAALALAVLPPLVRLFALGLDAGWETWVYRALTFLVASCPCALVISIPLSFFAGYVYLLQGGGAGEGLQLPGGPLPDKARGL